MNVSALLVFVSSISIMLRPTQAEVSEAGISMIITVLLMSQMFYKLDAQQCIIRGEYSIRGMMLKGHTFMVEKTGIWLNCLDKCDNDVRCQSFNYVISQGICELNNRTKEARPEHFVSDSDRFYIKRFRERVHLGSVAELPAESCAEIRASEGEDAVSGNYWFDSIKPGEVVLARCDMSKLDIDDCASHPCKNNGTCTDRLNGFNCSCAPGFNGTQCERDIDDCASHPCKNNGTCTDRVNAFNCSCAAGFHGTQCETDIDDCTSHPCKNNGTCTDRVNGFNCSCAPGFNGKQCETVDVCHWQNYRNLTDAKRKHDYVTVNLKCDNTLNGWYRFQGAAGTKMVTTCPPNFQCDAAYPIWLSDGHPTVAEGKVTRNVCINKFACCKDSFPIQVKNCGSYYIYKLFSPGTCSARYCSTD